MHKHAYYHYLASRLDISLCRACLAKTFMSDEITDETRCSGWNNKNAYAALMAALDPR